MLYHSLYNHNPYYEYLSAEGDSTVGNSVFVAFTARQGKHVTGVMLQLPLLPE